MKSIAFLILIAVPIVLQADVPTTRPATQPAMNEIVAKDVSGQARRPLHADGRKAAVVFFLSHDCPISNGYSPEINRIVTAYGESFAFTIVHPYAELSADEARKHAADFGYKAPVIVDRGQVITKSAGATITPEVAVISPTGEVVYLGRIDDRWTEYGKQRNEPTVRDLRNALDAILKGKPVPVRRTEAIGCPI